MDSDHVDISIHSGTPGRSHPLATDFPISILASISKRFKEDFESGNIDAVKLDSHAGYRWTIHDPNSLLSTKAMKIIFIWLCRVENPGHPEAFERIPVNVDGENWGIVGVAAVYGAMHYLELQGHLANRNHLRQYILDLCKTQWMFVWDDIVLAWWYLPDEDIMEQELVKAVRKYLETHDQESTLGARSEYAAFMNAIDSYHGRAEKLREICGSIRRPQEMAKVAKYRPQPSARRRQSPIRRRRRRRFPENISKSIQPTPATAVNATPLGTRRNFRK